MNASYLFTGYVGSKAPHHRKIRAFFDPYCKKYVEPFAGGAAVYFSMPNHQYEKEWLNDRNPNIATMYFALASDELRSETMRQILELEKPDDKDMASALYKQAQGKLLGMERYNVLRKGVLENERIIEIAVNTFLVYTQSFNTSGKGYSSNLGNQAYQWKTRERLMHSIDRLKNLSKVTNVSSIEIILAKCMEKDIQFYLDPPYIGVCRANKGKNYAVDMIDLWSHYELANSIKNAKSAIVLSGYRAPQEGVPTLYDAVLGEDWHCYEIGTIKNNALVVRKGNSKPVVRECIWTNRVPDFAKYEVSLDDCKEAITMSEYLSRIHCAIVDGRITDKGDIKDYKNFQRLCREEMICE